MFCGNVRSEHNVIQIIIIKNMKSVMIAVFAVSLQSYTAIFHPFFITPSIVRYSLLTNALFSFPLIGSYQLI